MAPKLLLPSAALTLWLFLACFIPAVEAYDAGDAIALLLGSVVTGVGFCACLGWYARKRNEQL
ncbi:hypothetical protein NL108_006100 [Boleophthalmus pectinirostris]|uniref:small integral membrane protein 30-like n=1 Tax=Boleophthalmus pectinirostris TaxID=150288 RepID=UPI00242F60C2|nr:small integral membrane protein 30-like [Boleophthalmus pectinirostris]KAJ0057420.1 hypothetical protein NL108_006100 [Boleophthalmus pectinirostris]